MKTDFLASGLEGAGAIAVGGYHALVGAAHAWHALGALVVSGLLLCIVLTRSRWVVALGALGGVYVLAWGAWLVADMMTGVGINQSVLFHLFSGTEDADYGQFVTEIVVFAAFVALASSLLMVSLVRACRHRGPRRHGPQGAGPGVGGVRHRLLPLSLGCLLAIAGWLASPWHQDLLALRHSYVSLDGADMKRLAALYRTESRRIGSRKNLVVLYLESLESTYFDETLFPGLLPQLSRLRGESAHFSGIAQTPGAGWTIAGLINTQCGLPLATPGPGVNDMGRVQYFLPKAKCLAEYLGENGFHTVYMGGASGEFAGKHRFLAQHGFDVVRDKAYFKQWQGRSDNAFSGWGAYDDELLEGVYRAFVDLSQTEDRFALFALTMDTHHPHGHISPSCEGIEYGDGEIKTLNALRCADLLVGRFIERVRASPYYDDTLLVVLSDHLAMVNDAKALIDQAERRDNLLMVFDEDIAVGERRVQGSMLDIGATLLDLLEADRTALGFGRSLLETNDGEGAYSQDYYADAGVMDYLSFSRGLWDMPKVVGQIKSGSGKGVLLGGNTFEAPFFSVLNESNRVVALYFYDFARHIEELKEGARYLYALECEDTHGVGTSAGICLVSGLKGGAERVFSATELVEGVQAAEIL